MWQVLGRGTQKGSVGKPKEKRPGHRCKDYIKTDLQELEWDMDWITLTHDKNRRRTFVSAVMKLWVS